MKQLDVKPALLAATFFALSCVECGGGIEATPVKLSRPANSPVTVGGARRKIHEAADGVVRSSKPHSLSSMSTKSSRRQLAMKPRQKTRFGNRQVADRNHGRFASDEKLSKRQIAMLGLASFYSEDRETASGESFNKRKLTAAHPSLPFGTRLRVTNVKTGRSVTVRVNDRGPFVHGRIIDVTSAAAEALGMVSAGVVKVTLDIIR